jgi:RNA ligase (TIGR02306 family)
MTRKLASIRTIEAILPIEGADSIEVAKIGGWKVVTQKGIYKEGDVAIFCEIDSWIPHELAPFLSKGKEPREFNGVKGERLRTIKLRGQLSQGLLLSLSSLENLVLETWKDGADLTELLGIQKWEMLISAQLQGQAKGTFPIIIRKTDQERVQNLSESLIKELYQGGYQFEISEKLEGSSMTCYLIDGVFGVCSRNIDLKETEDNTFWKVARAEQVEEKMRSMFMSGESVAVQGELIGPSIQGNIYGLKEHEFRVFDIFDIDFQEYKVPFLRKEYVKEMGLKHVPIINKSFHLMFPSVDHLLEMAEGKSELNNKAEREGIVFKSLAEPFFNFKAVSNKYLMSEK